MFGRFDEIHLLDINVFAKCYEIPSLPFQDIEKPKRRGRTDNVQTIYSPHTNTVCGGGGGGIMTSEAAIVIAS